MKNFLRRIHEFSILPDVFSVAIENLYAALRGKKVRFFIEKNGKLFAKEDGVKLKISNKIRGFWLYRNGIKRRADFLFKSYCLQNIGFKREDVVFDCGANSGDLFLELRKLINEKNYYAFEPNPYEFSVLTNNVGSGPNVFNMALGNTNDSLSFFVSTKGGDSSLVEPKEWDERITVSVRRLDSFINENNVGEIKLLKVEAEGFEPEILEGLGAMIACCEYVAIDGGYERGKNCEQTLTTCTNYLLANGFEMVDIYFPWHRALFKRKSAAQRMPKAVEEAVQL